MIISSYLGVQFQCAHCFKSFSTKAYRDQHQVICQGLTFTCMECGHEFESALQLQTHKQNVHAQP